MSVVTNNGYGEIVGPLTQDQWNKVISVVRKTRSGRLLESSDWNNYMNESCMRTSATTYCSKDWYTDNGVTTFLSYEEFMRSRGEPASTINNSYSIY